MVVVSRREMSVDDNGEATDSFMEIDVKRDVFINLFDSYKAM